MFYIPRRATYWWVYAVTSSRQKGSTIRSLHRPAAAQVVGSALKPHVTYQRFWENFVDCMISCEDGGNSGNRKIVYLSGKPPSPHRMKIKPRPSARLSGKISPARSTCLSLLITNL
jgi:hypothetical protein